MIGGKQETRKHDDRDLNIAVVVILIIVLIGILLGLGFLSSPSGKPADSLDDRIARVEVGVLPAVVVKGSVPATFTIEEMMEMLDVPGVSVAVIDEGEIAWARTYGHGEDGGGAPLTTEALFQAASVSKPVVAFVALSLVESGRIDLDVIVSGVAATVSTTTAFSGGSGRQLG